MKTSPTAAQVKLLDKIAKALRPHLGRESAITAHKLAAKVGSNDREVRRVISKHADYLWDRDVAVVSAIGHGFYCGDDLEEFQRNRDYLTALRFQISEKITALDRMCGARGIKLKEAA